MDAITIGVLGNLATDLVTWVAKNVAKKPGGPINKAIAKTAEAFPRYEDLSTTIQQWLESPNVIKVLYFYLKGLSDQESQGLEPLAEAFLSDTQFFLPDGGKEAARKIILQFLVQVRDEYLSVPALGLPYVANRVQEVLTLIRTHFEGLNFPIPPVPPQPLLEINRPRKLTRGRTNLLLRPHNEFIGVIGREPELSGLDAFCDNADAFRWSVLTGNGGVGKTRLALELAKRRAGSGWRAGFISAASLTSFVQHDEFPRWAPLADTLILLDYAASKTVALGRLLQQCTRWAEKASGAIRLRLVLLEREAVLESGWLHNLLNSAEGYLRDQIQDTLDSVQEISAPGGDDPDSVALRIVRATFEAWSKLSDDEAPPPLPELDQADLRGLRQRTDGKPLLLQVAALRACSERDVAGLSLWGREDLLDHTVTRERHYVERLFGAGTTRATLVERGIAFLTFTGPMPKDDQRWLSLLGKDARHLGFPNAQPGEVSADVAASWGRLRMPRLQQSLLLNRICRPKPSQLRF